MCQIGAVFPSFDVARLPTPFARLGCISPACVPPPHTKTAGAPLVDLRAKVFACSHSARARHAGARLASWRCRLRVSSSSLQSRVIAPQPRAFPFVCRPPRVLGCTSSKFPLNFSAQPIHHVLRHPPTGGGVVPWGPNEGAPHPPRCRGIYAQVVRGGHIPPCNPFAPFP